MTLPASYRNDRVGDGTTTIFPYTFKIWSAEEMRVVLTDPDTGVVTEPTSGFSVTGVGSDGGNVVFDVAPVADTSIVFLPTTTYEQDHDLVNETQFFQERIEDGLDKLCRQSQLLKEEASRTLRIPDAEAGGSALVLPTVEQRANKVLGFDADGNPIAGFSGSSVSAAMEPVVSAATLAAARAAMGVSGSVSISVKDSPYLAIGDGTTDDTNAVQAAITAAIASGSGVDLPPGTYIVTTLSIPATLRVSGRGRAVVKQKASTVANMIVVSGTSTIATFDGVTLDGNQANQGVRPTNATVRMTAVGSGSATSGMAFDGVEFINGAAADIAVYNDSTRTTRDFLIVRGCRFRGGIEGDIASYDPRYIDIRSPIDYEIVNNTFDLAAIPAQCGRAGVVAYDGWAYASTDKARGLIAGNLLINVGRSEATSVLGAIDVYNYGRSLTISGNVLVNPFGRGIQTKADAEGLSITGNAIDGLTGTWKDAQITVNGSVDANAGGTITVTGNTCLNSGYDGISIVGRNSGSTLWMRGVAVTGNVVKNCTRRGIALISVTDGTATGNVVDTCETGIYVEGVREAVALAANRITDTTGSGVHIDPTSSAAWLTITGNSIQDAGSRGIYIGSALGGTCIGNTIKNPSNTAIEVAALTGTAFLVAENVTDAASPFSKGATVPGLRFERNIMATALGFSAHSVTIAAGVITASLDWHYVDTEGAAATDDLDTINGGFDGATLTIKCNNPARSVVCKTGTGNMRLATNFTLNGTYYSLTLRFMGGVWHEISRATAA